MSRGLINRGQPEWASALLSLSSANTRLLVEKAARRYSQRHFTAEVSRAAILLDTAGMVRDAMCHPLMARVEWSLAFALICRLGTLDVEIHDHRILPASDYHRFTRHIWAGVNFLMRDVGRNINEISRCRLIAELQTVTPSHSGTTSHDVDHGLQFTMMVRGSFSVRLNNYGTSPQFAGPGTRVRNGGCPCHSRALGCVGVQIPSAHNFHAVLFPVQIFTRSYTEVRQGVSQHRVSDASMLRG